MPHPRLYTYQGCTQSLPEWALDLGIPYATLSWRAKQTSDPDFIFARNLRRGRRNGASQAAIPPLRRCQDARRLATRRILTWNGRSKSIAAWAAELGVKESTIFGRLQRRLSMEQVLAPKRCRTRPIEAAHEKAPRRVALAATAVLTLYGETMTIREWAIELMIPESTIVYRFRQGRSVEECLARPRKQAKRVRGPRPIRLDLAA